MENKKPLEYYLSAINYEDFLKYYDKIPLMEKDIYNMYCVYGFKQKEISELLGVTQGAVSHRLNRVIERIKYLNTLNSYCKNDIEGMLNDLRKKIGPLEFEIMKALLETTNQSHSAEKVNALFNFTGDMKLNQIKVRHHYNMTLKKLSSTAFFKIFRYVRDNLYLMSEVRLPQFDRKKDGFKS